MHLLVGLATLGQWRNVTVYDVLPEDCRQNVGNNDVGNAPGDIYFNTKDKYLPIACFDCKKKGPRGCYSPATFDCTNPESTGNLVVRKLEVEVYGDFGDDYQLCDVWPGSAACQYKCYDPGHSTKQGVGREAVCGGSKETCNMAPEPDFFHREPWDYWNYNTAALLGNTGEGEWYSLLSKDEGVYWRNAKILKVINQRCQARAYDRAVETAGHACFSACPQPTNQTSACWVHCFFETVLGPDADKTLKPPGKQTGAMNVTDLTTAWLRGFGSDDPSAGGCPPCPASGSCPDPAAEADGAAPVSPARAAPRPHVPLMR